MFNKLIQKWKEEWWEKKSDELSKEYASEEALLKSEFREHLEKDQASFNLKLEELRKEGLEVETRLIRLGLKKLELDEIEKRTEDKKLELIKLNEELKTQIRIAEGKSSPGTMWATAFSMGVSKAWDMLLPVMAGNIETLKKKIYDDATMDALSRLNGKKK